MTQLSTPAQAAEQAEAILQVFQSASHPLTVSQAEKRYHGPRLKRGQMRQLIDEQLLMQGQLFRCSPSGRSPRYWVHDEEHMVREKIEELLAEKPLPENKLVPAVNKALAKISTPAAIKRCVHALRHEGRLHEWPPPGRGKTKLLSTQPPDPLASVTLTKGTLKALSAALAKVQQLGGDLEQFLQLIGRQLRPSPSAPAQPAEPQAREERDGLRATQAMPPTAEIDELILKGMHDLNAAVDSGATVLLRDLRRHMPAEYRGHDSFDAAVIRLAEEERVVLHRHDQPAFLSDEERDELVRDAYGTYYVAIAQRVMS